LVCFSDLAEVQSLVSGAGGAAIGSARQFRLVEVLACERYRNLKLVFGRDLFDRLDDLQRWRRLWLRLYAAIGAVAAPPIVRAGLGSSSRTRNEATSAGGRPSRRWLHRLFAGHAPAECAQRQLSR